MAYFVKVKDGWVNLDAVARVVVMEDNSGQPERVLIYFRAKPIRWRQMTPSPRKLSWLGFLKG